MPYELDLNKGGSARLRQEIGLATTARAQGREGASPHYRFYELEPATVVDIDLTNKDSRKLGEARVRPLYSYASVPDAQLPIAVPLDSNIKNYPLKNEVVIVVEYGGRLYYTQRVNFFNLVNQNITQNDVVSSQDTTSRDYTQTTAGNANKSQSDSPSTNGGLYFKPSNKIQSLLPLEGDIIYEGRFGNSLRIGGTPKRGTSGVDKRFNNTWAFGDDDGQPIIILRSGQKISGDQTAPYIEDINKDPSSVYITNGQLIPLRTPNANLKTWKGTAPSVYEGNQILLSSDRIVATARKGEVMIFATNPISLSTQKEVHINATNEMFVNAKSIYLGYDAKEHVLLGDKTVEWVNNLVEHLSSLMDILLRLQVNTGSGPSATVRESGFISSDLIKLQNEFKKAQNTLKTLLSKQNYTL